MKNRIKEFLADSNMTQMDLCEKVRKMTKGDVKLAPSQVSEYASDKGTPNGATMIAIARALGHKVEEVFTG